MRTVFLLLVSLVMFLLGTVTHAQPAAKRPANPTPKSLGLPDTVSPMIGFFQGIDAKEKKVKLAFTESVAEVIPKTVKGANGKVETVFEEKYVPTAMANGVAFADIKFFNTKGEQLTLEAVSMRLKIGDALVISGDEEPIGAAYLKLIKDDAIIAIFPIDDFVEPLLDEALGPAVDVKPAPKPPVQGPPAPRPR